jgi:hypothetical protein
MESLDEIKSTSKKGFFKYVFNFDSDSKAEILNIIQYALIGLIPIVILNKSMQKVIPEADEKKNSFEILAEIVGQVLVIFIGLLFINRVIYYIPTYSGTKYPEFSIIYIILAILMITLSLQTKLGEKVSILFDRVIELWEGKTADKPNGQKKQSNNTNIRVMQPLSSNQMQQQQQQQQQSSKMAIEQSLYNNTTSIDSLPTYQQQSQQSQQQEPNFNSMYKGPNTMLVDAQSPIEGMNGGIMAANEVLGGAFGSNF